MLRYYSTPPGPEVTYDKKIFAINLLFYSIKCNPAIYSGLSQVLFGILQVLKKLSRQRETVETKKICTIDVGSSECKKDDLQGLEKNEHGGGGGGNEQDESLPDLDGPGVPLHPAEYVSAALLLGKKRLI